jgi:hypothetical protein
LQPRSPSVDASASEDSEEAAPKRLLATSAEAAWWSREALLGLAVSAALHAALLVALTLLLAPVSVRRPLPVQTVSVEMLSPTQFAVLTSPDAEILAAPPALPQENRPTPPKAPPALRHATKILSDRVGANVRRDLTTLALDTRFAQICGVEAMEQIAESQQEFRPERAVAYATADVKVIGNLMIANGAAFLSGGRWYALRFRCETSRDRLKVTSFDFATGDALVGDQGLGSGGED